MVYKALEHTGRMDISQTAFTEDQGHLQRAHKHEVNMEQKNSSDENETP